MICIILPTRNGGHSFKKTVECLIESTSYDYKILIIDNKSTDGTDKVADEFAKKYKQVICYHTKIDGFVPNMNFGIKKAMKMGCEGVYLTQDDVIHFRLYGRDWLLEMKEQGEKKNVGLVTCLNGGGISGPDYIKDMRWAGTWATYIPIKTFKKIGLFDENLGPGDDIDFSYRIGKAGYVGKMINYWVQHHRLTEHGLHDNSKQIKKMAKYFRKKHGL